MASLTIKGIPDDLLDELRAEAERERRSLNQQAIYVLERALLRNRRSFLERLERFYEAEGPPEDGGDEWDDVRSEETGRDVDV